jgi:hypothetical protein
MGARFFARILAATNRITAGRFLPEYEKDENYEFVL